jgi:glycerol kinase
VLATATLSTDLEVAAGTHRPSRFRRLLLTGGGSASKGFPHILADLLGLPVLTYTLSASAAVGAVLRAHHAEKIDVEDKFVPFAATVEGEGSGDSTQSEGTVSGLRLLAEPRKEVTEMYHTVHLPCFRDFLGPEEMTA